MRNKIKNFFLVIILAIIIVLVGYYLASLLRCEVLTILHGYEFVGENEQTHMISDVDYLKVLNYSKDKAEVYYVAKYDVGIILRFEKQDGAWVMNFWDAVWSASGSADGIKFPYVFDALKYALLK